MTDIRLSDLPESLRAHAKEFYDSGRDPVEPKLAATVLLVRPAGERFEVHAIRRVPTMPFAPGMYAFPGGTVDPRDIGADLRWAGPDAGDWAHRLGQDEPTATAVVCAAIREVFEETGVLLAGDSPDTVVGDVSGDDWEAQRAALVARELGFADFLSARDLMPRSDLLAPWSRWITPEFEPRRYDTYFFLARLPAGQRTRHVGGEADVVAWVRPADRADLPMLPPTRVTLSEVDKFPGIDDLMAAAALRDASTPIMPRLTDRP